MEMLRLIGDRCPSLGTFVATGYREELEAAELRASHMVNQPLFEADAMDGVFDADTLRDLATALDVAC
jgi:hypothetical protein